MKKFFDSIAGVFKLIKNVKTFYYKDVFENKRIAIIGPADSAYEKRNGEYIDSFDFVVRINKGPHSWTKEKSEYIGTKTDIWYHSFFENNESGGGPLNVGLMQKMEMKYLVNPRTDLDAYRRTFNFFRKYKKSVNVYHFPKNLYSQLMERFPKNLKPTIGFTALYSALDSQCSEIYITGFTFFKTPYAKGYRDHLRDLEDNKKHFKRQGIHDADFEYALFKEKMEESKCKLIKVDDKLKNILESE